MPKLTDIKAPDARLYTGPQPPKEPFSKKFLRWILAPIIWPIKILIIWPIKYFVKYVIIWPVKLLFRGLWWFIKTLLIKPAVWLGKFLANFFVNIKNLVVFISLKLWGLGAAIISGIKNFFSAIGSGFKNLGKLKGLFPNNWAGWLVLALALVVIWHILSPLGILPSLAFPAVDNDKWQAVFLTNNQVYFGHLQESSGNYTVLAEAYYLRPASGDQTKVDLVKLGDELHGPEQTMYIPKNQILFWENLKPDSQVVQLINQLKGQ